MSSNVILWNNDWTIGDNETSSNTTSLPYDQSPYNVKQAILIFRLVLLALGLIGNSLLIFVYIKCSNIITNRLGVYVINLCVAVIIDMVNVIYWSLKEFGYVYKNYGLLIDQLAGLSYIGLPTTSLFFFLMIFDRFCATCFAHCYKSCYGSKPNAIILSILMWLGSFFLIFNIIFPDIIFPNKKLDVILFLISYIDPFVIKLLLAIILIIKRKMVTDNDESQAFIERHRKTLYYTLTIIIIHLLLSLPYYILRTNVYFKIISTNVDQWIVFLCYTITEVPLVLNPIFCFGIDPEFRDSLVSVCTCSGRSRRDTTDIGDDHAESQPLAYRCAGQGFMGPDPNRNASTRPEPRTATLQPDPNREPQRFNPTRTANRNASTRPEPRTATL